MPYVERTWADNTVALVRRAFQKTYGITAAQAARSILPAGYGHGAELARQMGIAVNEWNVVVVHELYDIPDPLYSKRDFDRWQTALSEVALDPFVERVEGDSYNAALGYVVVYPLMVG